METINTYETKQNKEKNKKIVKDKYTMSSIQTKPTKTKQNTVISLNKLFMLFHNKFKISIHDSKFILYTLYELSLIHI